jgi:polar amino acid transport system substrate-binding protein
MSDTTLRRNLFMLGGAGLAFAAAGAALDPKLAAAQAAPTSLLHTVLDRGKLIVGTGSTNPPWHFEDDKGQLTGMDIAMGRILAKGLFDDDTKIEFVQQDPAARIPNIVTGKVDIVIQFMTVTAQRAQQAAFSRPYYIEGGGLLVAPNGKYKNYQALIAGGKDVKASILQNVYAETLVHQALPEAQVMQLDTTANSMQAVTAGRADAVIVDASTAKWLAKRNPGDYLDSGFYWGASLYSAAMRLGDPDWLHWVNTCFNVAMHGDDFAVYSAAYEEFFGDKPPVQRPGYPTF